jgi:hypothetical protein
MMRGRRTWQSGHPERTEWVRRVTEGFRALYGGDEAGGPDGGVVHVRA